MFEKIKEMFTKRIALHSYPYLFLIFSVLFYISENFLQATLWSALLTVLFDVLVSLVLTAILSFFIHEISRRSLVVFVLLIPLLTYGRIYNYLINSDNPDQYFQNHWPTVGAIALVMVGFLFSILVKKFPESLTKFLTIVTTIFVLEGGYSFVVAVQKNSQLDKEIQPISLNASAPKPDIYFLVYDEYTGPKALKDLYGYDDSAFTNQLQKDGFYVAEKSTANYFGSLHSVASFLNMQFLDSLTKNVTNQASDQAALQDLTNNNALVKTLVANGYEYDHLGSWFQGTRSNSNATNNFYPANHVFHLPLFTYHYLSDDSLLAPYVDDNLADNNRAIVSNQNSTLASLAATDGKPKFVFAHILMPHGPNIYSSTCQAVDVQPEDQSHYLDEVTCANSMILSTVEQIKAASKTPPIIVVMSDEGQELNVDAPSSLTDSIASFEEKYSNLAAFYFPNQDYSKLYPTITTVNTFRVILSQFFGANLPLLPDTNYLLGEGYEVNNSIDVTSKVRALMGDE